MRLELISEPKSVAVVRSKLRQLGASSGLEPELVDDLLTAVSEACNNVVLHAYRGCPGTLRVDVVVGDDVVNVEVSDSGSGIAEFDAESEDALLASQNGFGLGVALIQALAQQVVFADRPRNGLAVSMSFTRLRFGVDPHASSAAHGSGLRLHTNGKPRSSTSSRGRHRVRASGRVSPDSGASSLGWRTQAG